jgi:hypothetical protein
MKKKLLYLFIAISSIGFSQTLENTYTTSGYTDSDEIFSSFNSNGEIKYYTTNWSNNEIKIFNSSHILEKTVNITLENGYEMREIYLPSDKLFNSDSKIEFIVSSVRYSPYQENLTVYNEDGDNIFNFENFITFNLVKTPQNEYKLIMYKDLAGSGQSPITFSVYGLSGTLSVNQQNLLKKQKMISFPNPSSNKINVKNPLKNNENEKIQVFDINGRKVLEKKIIGNGENIQLDISKLSKGIYNYRIREFGNKFVKE